MEELVEGEDEGGGEVRDAELVKLEVLRDAGLIMLEVLVDARLIMLKLLPFVTVRTVTEGQIRLGGL